MKITGSEIRRELHVLQEAISNSVTEKFIKEGDPSLSVLEFLEQVAGATSTIKTLYAKNANDRNTIIEPTLEQVKVIRAACDTLEKYLMPYEDGVLPPEDTNRELKDWR